MVCYGNKWIDGIWGRASPPMTIREECFPGTAFAGCTGYPFPTLSFRAQREIFFVTPFASSFAKPFTGSTAYRLSAIRRFPFLAAKHSPSYRQRKRSRASLGMTLREYRSLTLPIYFPCNNDTREVPSTFAALLFFMRRTTPLNPTT